MTLYKKYGLLGRTLGHSLSPQIHELIFKYTGLEGEYKLYPMEPDKVEDFVLSLKENGFSGLNVTIPYKTDVLPFLKSISEEATKIGSVNTLLPKDSNLFGYNTDYFGVDKMLKLAGIDVVGRKVAVLGTGGSARTVAAYLKDKAASDIIIISRNKETAKDKFPELLAADYDSFKKGHGCDVLINTTPVGMYPKTEGCPLHEDVIKDFSAVADIIYNPPETKLLGIAKKNGAKVINGLYMLVAQAVAAQEIWNKIEIGDEVIDKIYNDIKKEQLNG